MALEFQADFDGYLDSVAGHGVSATIFNVDALWDEFPLIDTLGLIDNGLSVLIKVIIDQEFFEIGGQSIGVEGFQPFALIKYKDAPNISHNDRLVVDAITTRQGSTLVPETAYRIRGVENDNLGLVKIILEEE